MATYDLKYPGAAIDAILDTAYDLQNAGYIFRGLASEYYNTPTERSWVLAGEGETGHGFTSPIPKGYIGVCVFNGTSWTGKLLKCVSIDSTPTNGSTKRIHQPTGRHRERGPRQSYLHRYHAIGLPWRVYHRKGIDHRWRH